MLTRSHGTKLEQFRNYFIMAIHLLYAQGQQRFSSSFFPVHDNFVESLVSSMQHHGVQIIRPNTDCLSKLYAAGGGVVSMPISGTSIWN